MNDMTPLENLVARVRLAEMPTALRDDILEALGELSDARSDLLAMHAAIVELELMNGRLADRAK